jgi:hypothetical protein
MTRDDAKTELERIALEAPYERDRIQAIRLLREIWAEDDTRRQPETARDQGDDLYADWKPRRGFGSRA